jgi:long-chain acyl-CoA synthetase
MRAESVLQGAGGRAETLVDLLLARAQEPSKVAATYKSDGQWRDATWGEILERVKKTSAGLTASGVMPGDRVAIFAKTSLEWVICDLAVSASQAVTVPIYSSNTPDECRYILNNSEAVMLFVDDDESDGKQPGRLTRIRQKRLECPLLKQVVVFDAKAAADKELTLEDLVRKGEQLGGSPDAAFKARVAQLKADDPCCFIYTSGTTGDPKGVILTHGNWTYEAKTAAQVGLMISGDSVMLFLPMAHSFAQVVKAAWLSMAFRMIFAESIDKLLPNLSETHPNVLPSVPRVFEKVFSNVVANGSAAPGVKGTLFRWAFKLFDEYVEANKQGRDYSSLSFALAKRLVFHKVEETLQQRLGGQLRLFISGGAPLSKKIGLFFDLLGFKVLEGYGLTETSAATCCNLPDKIKIGTVGPPFPGTELQIAPDGEILVRGPGVMKGYYKNPAATQEVLQADGWFHTGDIGELDADGYLKITDRKKDIIVTAGGKKVPPQNLENLLKTFPIISQSMVFGDKRKYLTALICVSEEAARKLLAEKGVTGGDYRSLIQRPEIQAVVQAAIDQVNAEQPPYASLKKFSLVDHEFSQESGELTPTLKVKRKVVIQRYRSLLDGMYDEVIE